MIFLWASSFAKAGDLDSTDVLPSILLKEGSSFDFKAVKSGSESVFLLGEQSFPMKVVWRMDSVQFNYDVNSTQLSLSVYLQSKMSWLSTIKVHKSHTGPDFKTLMKLFACLSKAVGAKTIHIGDAAFFFHPESEGGYSARLYRAFEGKKSLSIYQSAEPSLVPIIPKSRQSVDYRESANQLHLSRIEDWEQIILEALGPDKLEEYYASKTPRGQKSDFYREFLSYLCFRGDYLSIQKLFDLSLNEAKTGPLSEALRQIQDLSHFQSNSFSCSP